MTFLSMQTIPNGLEHISVWQAGLHMSDVRTYFARRAFYYVLEPYGVGECGMAVRVSVNYFVVYRRNRD
jgi:hypothetical protein